MNNRMTSEWLTEMNAQKEKPVNQSTSVYKVDTTTSIIDIKFGIRS